MPNYLTISGKAFPSIDNIQMKVGQTIERRFIGTQNDFVHPMHVHGGSFQVIAVDGCRSKRNYTIRGRHH